MEPLFTIIVPTYNRPKQLEVLLESLTKLAAPEGGFEVIIVDDGSQVDLNAVAEPFYTQLSLTLLLQSNSGPAQARNYGTEQARTYYIAFTDDDCTPDSNWLIAAAAHLNDYPDVMVGGKIINRLTSNRYAETSQLIVDMVYAHYNAQPQATAFFTSNNIILPREQFLDLGGFDVENFGYVSEDRDLCDRWLQAGYVLHHLSEAIIYHAHDLTLQKFLRQHFHYGQGAWAFYRARERLAARADMSFHTSTSPWQFVRQKASTRRDHLHFGALLGLWQFAYGAGYVSAVLTNSTSSLTKPKSRSTLCRK